MSANISHDIILGILGTAMARRFPFQDLLAPMRILAVRRGADDRCVSRYAERL
jgi:hypothetical protein